MSYAKSILGVNEAYFGIDAMKDAQLQFNKIRAKFRNKPFTTNMAKDPDVLKFNRTMERIFGFTVFSLCFNPDRAINAYALPIILAQTEDEKKRMISALSATKSGFRFEKMGRINGLVTLNKGIIDSDLTDEELVAIMLHEIGHNFFEAVMDSNCIYTITSNMIRAIARINQIIAATLRTKLVSEIDPSAAKKDVENICRAFKGNVAKYVIQKPMSLLSNLKSKVVKRESFSSNMTRGRLKYTNEKFADTFATMYGYGPALHSALLKLMDTVFTSNNPMAKNPVYNVFLCSTMFLGDILAYIANIKDEHPDGLARINVSCEYIRSEIAKEDIDPKLKEELIGQLREMEALIEDFINFPKDKDSYTGIRMYYIYLYKTFGGDLREMDTDNDAIFKTIDQRYNQLNKN